MLLSTAVATSVAKARWFTGAWLTVPSLLVHALSKLEARLTSSDSGPDDGVASPLPFAGIPLLHLLNLNGVARSAARGVRLAMENKMTRRWLYAPMMLTLLLACATERKPDLIVELTDTAIDLPSGYGRVEGLIKANGRAVAATQVQLMTVGLNDAVLAKTDKDGRFTIAEAPAGKNSALIVILRCKQRAFPAEVANNDCSKHTVLRRFDVLPGKLSRLTLNVECSLCDGVF
jgi:hypothetical protein